MKTSHFVLSRRRASFDFRQTFLCTINSLAARSHWKCGWNRLHRGKLFIILSSIELNQPNLADLCRLRMHIKPVNFVRIAQGVRPLGAIILVKFEIFKVFWAANPHPWTDQGEICQMFKLCKFCKNRARTTRLLGAINYIGKILNFYSFGGRKPTPLSRSRWNLAGSFLPNFTLIGVMRCPCGAKNRKIGPWVKQYRHIDCMRFVHLAGNQVLPKGDLSSFCLSSSILGLYTSMYIVVQCICVRLHGVL